MLTYVYSSMYTYAVLMHIFIYLSTYVCIISVRTWILWNFPWNFMCIILLHVPMQIENFSLIRELLIAIHSSFGTIKINAQI